jgi:uncharacterized protein (TIGR02611 family)
MTQLTIAMHSLWHLTYKTARRLVVGVIGGTVVLVGIVLFFTPGPAIVVIPIGLAILATEFVWARRLLKRMKDGAQNAYNAIRNGRGMSKAAPRGDGEETPSAD